MTWLESLHLWAVTVHLGAAVAVAAGPDEADHDLLRIAAFSPVVACLAAVGGGRSTTVVMGVAVAALWFARLGRSYEVSLVDQGE
ncbi:hypothetical protein E1091_04235 [Micromonospora fluostatini]|uniref:Sensor histidine kinase n=1 Tax=Micromonospora fluostatini TaxID=1629071 RepID=A0ABY2DK25_9ACTN|nr:hypothetical protein E1091_04235 [Micromonospora fluostatini]